MFQRPSDSELKKPKTYDGKPWYYCSHETGGKCDGIFRRHKPEDCRGTGGSNPHKGNTDKPSPTKRLKVEQALAALSVDDDDSSVRSE